MQVEREQISFSAMLLSEEGYGAQEWQAVDVRFTHRQVSVTGQKKQIEKKIGVCALNNVFSYDCILLRMCSLTTVRFTHRQVSVTGQKKTWNVCS
jgi:hypothetical protein